jgi:quinol monooxygenase YgiN
MWWRNRAAWTRRWRSARRMWRAPARRPGCIAHAVHRDTENSQRLVFVEQWADMDALKAHFRVPESRAFGKALMALATEPPGMALFDATPAPV